VRAHTLHREKEEEKEKELEITDTFLDLPVTGKLSLLFESSNVSLWVYLNTY